MSGILNPGVRRVSVAGSSVQIGETTFRLGPDGEIRGLAANRPSAASAHAVIPHAVFWSTDTGVFAVTDGTNWVPL